MKFLSLLLMIAASLVFFADKSFASVSIRENFQPGLVPAYVDDTTGMLQLMTSSGNRYAKFSFASGYDPSYYQLIYSAIYFEDVQIDMSTSMLRFDYKYEYQLNLPSGKTVKDVDFSTLDSDGTDYFHVFLIDADGDFIDLFSERFDPSAGFSTWVTTSLPFNIQTDPPTLDGFKRVTLDVAELFDDLNLAGQTITLFFEILNAPEKYISSGVDLTLNEYKTEISIDNVYLGSAASVPEPAVYSLFIMGLWIIVKRKSSTNMW